MPSKRAPKGRCGLGRGLDDDVAAWSTAHLELREELAHFPAAGRAATAEASVPSCTDGGEACRINGAVGRRRGEVSVCGGCVVLRLVGGVD